MKTDIRKFWKKVSHNERCKHSTRAKLGLDVRYNPKHLAKVTNVTWTSNGMLDNGICHYERRMEISGNTYPWRERFKKAGFKWDAGKECWYFDPARTNTATAPVCEWLLKVAAKNPGLYRTCRP